MEPVLRRHPAKPDCIAAYRNGGPAPAKERHVQAPCEQSSSEQRELGNNAFTAWARIQAADG